MRTYILPLLLVAALALTACGTRGDSTVALAMDGPPLVLMGEYKGAPIQGSLDRTAMAGVGALAISGLENGGALVCESKFNNPPTEKGRVVGFINCGESGILAVMLRNLGPDQGVGIAHAGNPDELMIFFYHPCREEAERRLPGVIEDILTAQGKRKEKEGEQRQEQTDEQEKPSKEEASS